MIKACFNSYFNKNTLIYLLINTLDIQLYKAYFFKHIKEKLYYLLAKQSNHLSKNKYNVGLLDIMYTIRISSERPVKGYI